MIVMMALATTVATTPAFDLLAPWFRRGRDEGPTGVKLDGPRRLTELVNEGP